VNVPGREAQEHEAGVDQEVLPAVVFDESVTVGSPVVLDHQARRRIVEISSTDKLAMAVVEVRLDMGRRQSGLQQNPPKSSLHGGLSRLSMRC